MNQQHEREDDKGSDCNQDEFDLSDGDKPPDTNLPPVTNETAGLTAMGNWTQITNFCKHFTFALKQELEKNEMSTPEAEDWDRWRPRKSENQQKVDEKSASQAAFQPDRTPDKNLEKSASDFHSSRQEFKRGNQAEGMEQLASATAKLLTALLTYLGKGLGRMEGFLYRQIITKTNAAYFDSNILSANLEEYTSNNGKEDQTYKIQIKIHDESLRKRILDDLPI